MGNARRRLGDATIEIVSRVVLHKAVARRLFREVMKSPAERGLPTKQDESLRFLSFCHAHRALANGQLLQDLWVLYETEMLNNGYFVEFGAFDGIVHSNTLILEQKFGWSGLLAEPNPDVASTLQANRTAIIDTRCVWSTSGEILQLLVTADPELSTIDDRASQDTHSACRRESSRRVPVETVSLSDLLDRYEVPAVVDYLSVDTEGTELELLTSFDWSRRKIGLVSVEHNHRADERSLDRLMFSNGYERRFPEFSNIDAWYRKR